MKKLSKIVGGISAAIQSALDLKADISAINVANSSYVKTAVNASGSAPIYAARAFGRINMTSNTAENATYSRSGTTVTVTLIQHVYRVGDIVYFDATTGAATDGVFTVVDVPSIDTFTFTHGTSGSTSGNCLITRSPLITGKNVSSVAYNNTGIYSVNVTTDLPTASPIITFGAADTSSLIIPQARISGTVDTVRHFQVEARLTTGALVNASLFCFAAHC